jgi:hypothetical protein
MNSGRGVGAMVGVAVDGGTYGVGETGAAAMVARAISGGGAVLSTSGLLGPPKARSVPRAATMTTMTAAIGA